MLHPVAAEGNPIFVLGGDGDVNEETPVLVVGAGPTGLVLACVLVRAGVRVRLIDKAEAPPVTSRALAIFPRTMELFEKIGVLEEMVQAGVKLSGLTLNLDAHSPVKVSFESLPPPFPYALSLPQADTEAILRKKLAEAGVGIDYQTELIGFAQDRNGVRVVLRQKGRELHWRTQWVIGCDGAHSSVRHILGAPFEGSHLRDRFVLADVEADSPYPGDEAQAFLSGKGVLAVIPLGNGRLRIIADRVPAGESPDLEQIRGLVRERVPREIAIRNPLWISQFTIARRQVRRYREGHVFLAGDAAHIHSPVGGQGMNTGIQDAFNLGWKLALYIQGLGTSDLLSSYGEEREPVAKGVLRLTHRMTRLITTRNRLGQRLRNRLLPWLLETPWFRRWFVLRIAQISIRYRKSPVVWDFVREPLRAGDRAPDARLLDAVSGKGVRLFDFYTDPRHVLLIFTGLRDGGKHAQRVRQVRSVIDGAFSAVILPLVIETEINTPLLSGTLLDELGAVHRLYDADAGGLVLVRPDGVIGFRSDWRQAKKLWKYLSLCFRIPV